MSDAEEAIARAQTAAVRARGGKLGEHQSRNIRHLDERILTLVSTIAMIGLATVWATATSPLLLQGSLGGIILLSVSWGMARFKRLDNIRRDGQRQAAEWQSGERDSL